MLEKPQKTSSASFPTVTVTEPEGGHFTAIRGCASLSARRAPPQNPCLLPAPAGKRGFRWLMAEVRREWFPQILNLIVLPRFL